VLAVPDGVSWLVATPGELPEISIEPPDPPRQIGRLEPVGDGGRLRLLFALEPGVRVAVNGAPAPGVSVLGERDQIGLEGGRLIIHVSTEVQPYVGEPGALAGRPCSVCSVTIRPDSRVYVCGYCGEPAHLETEDEKADPKADPSECAAGMSTCPACGNPVVTRKGLTWVPEGIQPCQP